MYYALFDEILSSEAKAIVSQEYMTGTAQVVSSIVSINKICKLDFIQQIIVAGWGETLAQFTILDFGGNVKESQAIINVQLSIINGKCLFAFNLFEHKNNYICYIAIHHALADEKTIYILSDALKSAAGGNVIGAIEKIKKGRKEYIDYVREQKQTEIESYLRKSLDIKPVRLGGYLAWNKQSKRVCISRRLKIKEKFKEFFSLKDILDLLYDMQIILEGNIVCTSRDWRLDNHINAVGMMTGLMPICISDYDDILQGNVSLEAQAQFSKKAKTILECCRNSDLFINGASCRQIQGNKVVDAFFPVGISIKYEEDVEIEIEGKICNQHSLYALFDILESKFT